jgi:acyl carrier protein
MSEITYKEIEDQVLDIVEEQFCVCKGDERYTVTLDTNFREDLGADSIDAVELLLELENTFEIQIPDEAIEKIETVQQAIDYIVERLEVRK